MAGESGAYLPLCYCISRGGVRVAMFPSYPTERRKRTRLLSRREEIAESGVGVRGKCAGAAA